MKVTLEKVSKRFEREWIIRELSHTFEAGGKYAILGPNGSGKSTLMQLICGNITTSAGTIEYHLNDTAIPVDEVYKHLSLAAPYLQLVEEFTLQEQLTFHSQFKAFVKGMSVQDVLAISGLEKAKNKEIRNFSSGMKQRVKLILAILSDVSLILLDEPATNLDVAAVDWYLNLIDQYAKDQTILVSSNRPDEYPFTTHELNILDYK